MADEIMQQILGPDGFDLLVGKEEVSVPHATYTEEEW